ncbi:MAG: aldehyde dehydrogenase family protein [Saprospiraceae bacterium]|nr:aldehyde dehydrogenase family protein [Saprospiraceae bacterium]
MSSIPAIEHLSLEFLDLKGSFQNLLDAYRNAPFPSLKYRLNGLQKLEQALLSNRMAIQEAINKDFKKPFAETDGSELLTCLVEIRKARKELKYWMQKKQVKNPLEMFGTKSFLLHEPKGVVLILSPWNYPINLSIIPLIAAWAAGNKIVLKPSEFTKHTSQLIAEIIESCFSKDEVMVVQGDAQCAESLLLLPFHHIYFTGSKEKAKKLVKLTADRLIPVTLELGGKSPVIIDEHVDLKRYVKDIAFAKCLNAGQTCIAPDFILLPEKLKDPFLREWNLAIENFYGEHVISNENYCGIIHKNHFDKLCKIVYQSLEQGAQLEGKFEYHQESLKIKPVLLWNSDWGHVSMESELFGPILPILFYKDKKEIISNLNKMSTPLSLYLFSENKSWLSEMTQHIKSGGVTYNNCLLNYCNFNLPFGGLQESGTGSNHGRYGFESFSHLRAISVQGKWFKLLRNFHPPYTDSKKRIMNLFIKLIGKI